jgi:HPt (histidine-containing phosphotransfer) domain-containing protein
VARCKLVGMNDYIAKPVDEQVLYNKILGLVKSQSTAAAPENKKVSETRGARCTDLNYLNKRTKSDPALMMEMITLYLDQTPILIKTMRQSIKDKDWVNLKAAAHKMIPSFAIMGINEDFEKMAKKILDYAHTQEESSGIEDIFAKLAAVCEQACVELHEEFHTIKNTIAI